MSERPDLPKKPDDAPNLPVTEPEREQDVPATPQRTKRRWLRYSLRTFLLLVTAGCVWLGLLVHRVSKQKEAIQRVRDHGGWVHYDFEWDEERQAHIEEAEPPGPVWLRELIGVDYFADVVAVGLEGTDIDDAAPLQMLPQLQWLNLYHTSVSDLGPLRELTELRALWLSETPISNLDALREMRELRWITLLDTPVSDLRPLRELRHLRVLGLTATDVSDISPLRELTELEELWLGGTRVTDLTPLAGLTKVKVNLFEDQQVNVPMELEGRVIWK